MGFNKIANAADFFPGGFTQTHCFSVCLYACSLAVWLLSPLKAFTRDATSPGPPSLPTYLRYIFRSHAYRYLQAVADPGLHLRGAKGL